MNKSLKLFTTFFKIGLFTFGGGLAMLPMIEKEVVSKHKWISEEQMLEIIAIAESTPGPIAINAATFIGRKINGYQGALIATFAVALPSFSIMMLISLFLEQFLANKYVAYAFYGINIGIIVLLSRTFIKLFKKSKKSLLSLILITGTCVIALMFKHFSLIYLIIIGGIIGVIYHSIHKMKRREKQ